MKLPTYFPAEQNEKVKTPIIGTTRSKAIHCQNRGHMIHPDSNYVMYPDGELDLEAEFSGIEHDLDKLEDETGESLDLEKDKVRAMDSEEEQKEALSYMYVQISQLFAAQLVEDDKQEALGGS